MNTRRVCLGCGGLLNTDAPEGLCPRCLLSEALQDVSLEQAPRAIERPTIILQESSLIAAFPTVRYFGDYELLEEIARGGMGVVYRARQISLNRPVAVKMILSGQLASETEVNRFHREAEAAANLKHPNLVAIHEVGEHAGQHFYSMDLIDGESLGQHLRRGPISIGEVVRLTKIMAEAVHFAHQRGILHRDLKPANVLLDRSGQPHLTDFGLAKRTDRTDGLTQSGAVFGTPAYMPPEQAAGRQDLVSAASDTYSLGAILYEMLTGKPPFCASTPAETISRVIIEAPTPPSQLNRRIPPDLETICLKCLEKRPDGRYESAAALAQDLERFFNHDPISARPASVSQRFSRWLLAHPQGLAALGCAVLLTLIWTGYGLWSENSFLSWEREHPEQIRPINLWPAPDTNPIPLFGLLLLGLVAGMEHLLQKRTRKRVLQGVFSSARNLTLFEMGGVAGLFVGVLIGMGGIETWLSVRHALPLERRLAEAKLQAQLQTFKELYRDPERWANASKASTEIFYWDVRALEKRGSLSAFGGSLLLAVIGIWRSATLFLKAFREQRFVFFLTNEEEKAARERAILEEQQEVADQARRIPAEVGLGIVLALLLLLFLYPFLFDGGMASYLLGGAGPLLAVLTNALGRWRDPMRKKKFHRAILVISGFPLAFGLMRGPALTAAFGFVWGVFVASALWAYLRWYGSKRPAKACSER